MQFKSKMMDEAVSLLGQVIASRDEKFHNYCTEVTKLSASLNLPLIIKFSKKSNLIELAKMLWHNAKAKIPSFPQYALSHNGNWRILIPTRAPQPLKVDGHGRYIASIISEKPLSRAESDVFHFSSGKLTGEEIARLTGKGEEEMKSILSSLEEKGCIFYRTF